MLIYISTPPPRTFGISLSSFIQPGTKPQKNFQYLFSERLCHSMWLFHLHSTVKIQPFYPVFPLAGSTAKAFFQLSLWNFKEKSINYFL